jgi:hypothetical protein
MKPLSARTFKPLKRWKRKKNKNYRNQKLVTGTTDYALEHEKYDPTDIATKEELENDCDCIIHSGGHRVGCKPGYVECWVD